MCVTFSTIPKVLSDLVDASKEIFKTQLELQQSDVLSRDLQKLEECIINFIDCEVPNQFDELETENIDILCNYGIVPESSEYESNVFSTDENGDCVIGSYVPAASYISVSEPRGYGINGLFGVKLNVDRDLLAYEMGSNQDEYSFEFCIKSDIIVKDYNGNDVKLAPHMTKVEIELVFDGTFVENIDLEAAIAYNEFSISKKYSVEAYLCSKDPPHSPIDPATQFSPSEIMRVCVITNDDDTLLQNILYYELVQYDGLGFPVNNFIHVKNGVLSGLSAYDCTKTKPGSTLKGSLCLIESKATSMFFVNPILGLVAKGNADLRLREQEYRRLQYGGGDFEEQPSTDGSYELRALLSREFEGYRTTSGSPTLCRIHYYFALATLSTIGFII